MTNQKLDQEKLDQLTALGDHSITAAQIAECRRSIEGASPCDTCVTIGTWVIKAAAPLGCVAGSAAITGLFVLADIIFVIADEILVPLEAVVEVAFGVACNEIGAPALEARAAEFAKDMCVTAKIC